MKFRIPLLFSLILYIFSIPVWAQDEEVIKIDSSLVLLNATVTDEGGKPLSGLKKTQFTVLEDGLPQEISLFETESTPFAAVILIDSSGSMEQRIVMAR